MPIICVDGVAYRYQADGTPEVLAILRNTGEAIGKWCVVGGRITGGRLLRRESVEQALQAHFKRDLGVEITIEDGWQRPFYLGQCAPCGSGDFGLEKAKHAVAPRYLVRVADEKNFIFGEGFGGREVADVRWFSQTTLPKADEFGYDHHETFRVALETLASRR